MESILTSIKLLLFMTEDYTPFDPQVIMHINSIFPILRQLGVGPANGFRIEDDSATWSDYIPVESEELTWDMVKTYIYAKVKLIFDPPASSAHIEALKETIKEFECRLRDDAEFTKPSE